MTGDKHLAVIMARGDSKRMGQPKGLCRLPGQDRAFLARVARLYHDLGIPALVVINRLERQAYQELVARLPVAALWEEGGGDTAQTLNLAWRWATGQGQRPGFIWAHPVDLPLVLPATLKVLRRMAQQEPGVAWRPRYGSHPGHPVVIPGPLMKKLAALEAGDHSMAELWALARAQGLADPIKTHPVDDPAVVQDFDTPDDLARFEKMERFENE